VRTLSRAPVTTTAVLVIVAILQFLHYYPILPDRIAVHFGPGWEPDAWSDTRSFMIVYGLVEGLVVVTALLGVLLMERGHAGAVNIPNRDYWLSAERRRETLHYLAEQFLWLECLTLAFLIAVAQTIFKFNLRGVAPLLVRDFWVTFVAFLVGIGWVCARLAKRFGRKPPVAG